MSKILAFAELRAGEIRNVSFETIAAAKQIDADAEIVAVVLGNENTEEAADKMIQYGADRAVTVTDDQLENFTSDAFTQTAMAVIEKEN